MHTMPFRRLKLIAFDTVASCYFFLCFSAFVPFENFKMKKKMQANDKVTIMYKRAFHVDTKFLALLNFTIMRRLNN